MRARILADPDAHRRRRQPALAPAHGDRQLHPRDGRRAGRGGRRRARAGGVRAVRAARSQSGSARRSPGWTSRCAPPLAAARAAARPGAARGRPPVERLVGRLDVFHFSDWMYPPQRAGLRATTVHDLVPLRFPDWVEPETLRMHGPKYEHAAQTCDRIFANSRFTGGEVVELLGVPEERVVVAYPGIDPIFSPTGEAADLGGPYVLGSRTLEPRKNLPALVAAFGLLRQRHPELTLALAGLEGWEQRPLERRGRAAARLRLRRRARPPLPRRGGVRLPVAVRGLRDPGRRGARERRARRWSRRIPRWTRRAARPPCGPTRTTPRPSRTRSSRRSPLRAGRGVEHAARASPGAPAARPCSQGYLD